MNEDSLESPSAGTSPGERACAYGILRYTPNVVRDEWLNIGVLTFDPKTGERRLRLIEEQDEYNRIRRLHPQADEMLLGALRDDLEDRFQRASANGSNGRGDWQQLLGKWDDTLSNALQLATQKGVFAVDLDAELERLYGDHVVPQRAVSGRPAAAPQCARTARRFSGKARRWDRIEKSVRASVFTFPGSPMRLDYSHRRSGTRGFVQSLSVTRGPADAIPGLHRRAHHRQSFPENRICRRHRCGLKRGK